MKKEIRLLGIDDGPFNRGKDKTVIIIGAFFRGGSFLDGVVSTRAKIDGIDATKKITAMINKSKFKKQIQCILLNGIAVGGFNVIDISKLREETGIPVIVIVRRKPDINKIIATLRKIGKTKEINAVKIAGKSLKINNLYIQLSGISLDKAQQILKIGTAHAIVPEALRVAHLIAGGVVRGESKGKS
ncbi:MAG: DUF99 family protein [Nanoarchaeota archaeon]